MNTLQVEFWAGRHDRGCKKAAGREGAGFRKPLATAQD